MVDEPSVDLSADASKQELAMQELAPAFEEAVEQLSRVRDWIRWGASEFNRADLYFGHGTDNAWDEAAALVLWVIRTPWTRLDSVADTVLTRTECGIIAGLFQRRIHQRVPAAYLTGEAWFAGLKFVVNSHVLVPRSPIAELIQQQFQPWLGQEPERILDLCTGSGCIGIACAYAFPDAQITLSDISPDALAVAAENVRQHGLQEQVEIVESDGLSCFAGRRFDLIVSNPPYVDAQDMAALPPEYRAEPELGLTSGKDGLDFTRRLLREAAAYLSDDGLLVVEVGNSAPVLEAAFPQLAFTWLEFEQGGHGVFTLSASELRSAFPA